MLFLSRRFFPLFVTQFFGAFNDCIFKSALLLFVVTTLSEGRAVSLYSNLAMVLFILPMLLFSAFAGILADRMEKHRLILLIKTCEVCIMVAGMLFMDWGSINGMLVVLFLLGLQASFFGPVKYGILPERLRPDELMQGNGLVEAGTFLAILSGTLLGSHLVGEKQIPLLLKIMAISTVLGYLGAYFIPKGAALQKPLPRFQPLRQTGEILRYCKHKGWILRAILDISWFWFLGGALLTEIPQYSRDVLGADTTVTSYLLGIFSAGLGVGSISAYRFSRGRIDVGLSAVASIFIGLGLLGMLSIDSAPAGQLYNWHQFYHQGAFWQVSVSFFLTAFAGGVFIVPLYALIQNNAEVGHKSRMIAANNIMNTLFMIASNVLSIVILSWVGWSVQMLFALFLVAHVAVTVRFLIAAPSVMLWLISAAITGLGYRLKITGREHIPREGAAILLCNHVTYLDPVFLFFAARRQIRFVMYYKIYDNPALNWLFRWARCIPIAARHESEEVYQQALHAVDRALARGELVGIFPEGKLTKTGLLNPFREGIIRMLERNPVPVIPAALGNLWGSFFSHKHGLCRGGFEKFRALVPLSIGAPLAAESSIEVLQRAVMSLRAEQRPQEEPFPMLLAPKKNQS